MLAAAVGDSVKRRPLFRRLGGSRSAVTCLYTGDGATPECLVYFYSLLPELPVCIMQRLEMEVPPNRLMLIMAERSGKWVCVGGYVWVGLWGSVCCTRQHMHANIKYVYECFVHHLHTNIKQMEMCVYMYGYVLYTSLTCAYKYCMHTNIKQMQMCACMYVYVCTPH